MVFHENSEQQESIRKGEEMEDADSGALLLPGEALEIIFTKNI